jgi:hypothetical protein
LKSGKVSSEAGDNGRVAALATSEHPDLQSKRVSVNRRWRHDHAIWCGIALRKPDHTLRKNSFTKRTYEVLYPSMSAMNKASDGSSTLGHLAPVRLDGRNLLALTSAHLGCAVARSNSLFRMTGPKAT